MMANENTPRIAWYVMIHMNPNWIEQMLQPEFASNQVYLPYLNMPHIAVDHTADDKEDDRQYNPTGDENALRGDLRNFVFVQTSEERIEALLKSDWNQNARFRMYHYRDTTGKAVTIPDAEMRCFIKTLQDHHLKFFLDQPVDHFSVGDKVILQMDPWVGKTAEIKEIRVKKDRTSITVALNIFNRTKSLNFPDVNPGDVVFVDKEKGRLLSGNPIVNYEEEVLDLLSHRFKQRYSEELAEDDKVRLKRLASYSRIYAEDPEDQARFAAMKLICAYLRENRGKVELCTKDVQGLLRDPVESMTDAYLTMALFITTRDPNYRDAVKTWRQSHPDTPSTFRRLYAIVKEIKAKKRKKK